MAFEDNKKFWKEFIELYREHACLWDVNCKEYSNRSARNRAYDALVMKCREKYPTAEKYFVAKKINSLRTSFRRQFRKIQDSTSEFVEPTLWYFDLLLFTIDQEELRPGVIFPSVHDVLAYEDMTINETDSQHEYIVPEPRTDLDSDAGHSYSPQPTEQELAPVAPKKRKKTKEATNWTEPKRVDSNSLYGEYVADSIRNLKNRTLQSWVRHQISNVLYTAEQAYFQNPSQCLKVDDMNFTIDTSTLPNLQSGGEEKKTDSEAKEPKGSPGVNEPASTTKEAEIYFKEEPLFFKEPNSPKSPTTLT